MSWDEYDEASLSSSARSSEDIEGASNKDSSEDNSGCKDLVPDNKDTKNKTEDDCSKLYITALGEEFFYLLIFDGSNLTLIKRVKKKISSQVFAKDLYIISDKKLYGFHDVVSSPDSLDEVLKPERKRKKVNGSLLNDESHEEYTYRPFRKDRRIIFKREEGKSDIANNWEGFFITRGLVHKIVYEDGGYTFVYNSKKYSYEKEIGRIAHNNEMLVYYLKGKDSKLYFQEVHEKIYSIPKITTMSCEGQWTVVGTADGYIYLFNKCVLSGRKKVYNVPITGVGFMNESVYFSSFDGFVGVHRMSGRYNILHMTLPIAIFIFAILIGLILKPVEFPFTSK
ncbi:uncharacterized protein Eint_091740 [Encephalitozoon intestinalis ATCC 50506]|uniref:Uncharacterized protein n=1 Tax=Encephalitozoon intestinalis (strain ATCC 50506) TaxID=876142 RepID=E0S946_ENCIT|nr:uncharacterized protein Eint_091740 [Encephalitozoon intestinalis ATCC 50506]ADM12302.1 hypothetical protein Eint_091740 [Encephalitozoon intestinalis ATCC 50506]